MATMLDVANRMNDLNDLHQLTRQDLVEEVIIMEVRLNDTRIS